MLERRKYRSRQYIFQKETKLATKGAVIFFVEIFALQMGLPGLLRYFRFAGILVILNLDSQSFIGPNETLVIPGQLSISLLSKSRGLREERTIRPALPKESMHLEILSLHLKAPHKIQSES